LAVNNSNKNCQRVTLESFVDKLLRSEFKLKQVELSCVLVEDPKRAETAKEMAEDEETGETKLLLLFVLL